MRIATDVLCACGAPMDEIDTGAGLCAKCTECGLTETWPEHIGIEPAAPSAMNYQVNP